MCRLYMLSAVFFVCFVIAPAKLYSQAELFQAEEYVDDNGNMLPYRVLFPEEFEEGKTYPLVLFLHGAGERGTNNEAQLTWGVTQFAEESFRQENPAIVIAPQAPEEDYWANPYWREEGTALLDKPTRSLALAYELLQQTVQEYPVDENRIYVTGLSMGGFGTWDLIARYPDLFAAAVPVCAGGDVSKAHLLTELPIWAFHGALDDVVPPEHSREMIDAIRQAGGLPGYTEYPDVNHGSWVPAYNDGFMLEWMFRQVKGANQH